MAQQVTQLKPREADDKGDTNTESEAKEAAAKAAAKADTSAAVPSGGKAESGTKKTRPKPSPKSQIPTGQVYFVDEDGNLGKEGTAQGLEPKEVLNAYLNSLDEDEQDAAQEQAFYAVNVNGKFKTFEIDAKRTWNITEVEPDSI